MYVVAHCNREGRPYAIVSGAVKALPEALESLERKREAIEGATTYQLFELVPVPGAAVARAYPPSIQ